MKPTTLILRTAGTNCDRELAHAFELAGSQTQSVHLNHLIEHPELIEQADLIGIPGGFSYGDDIAAGRIFANRLRHRLLEPLKAAVARGTPMIGICNGFQVLVKLGLLPDPKSGKQTATLADNTSGRFIAKWVSLQAISDTVCIWTRGLDHMDLPIAHGEGRFVPADDAVLQRLREQHQIALRYADAKPQAAEVSFPGNPNGSIDAIAGICDPSGVVLGLMPHPERYTHSTNHPNWSRQSAETLAETPAGLRLFQNAVEHVLCEVRIAG
ncbi:MAG: phosphoribosylformylglycinamidine synthase I [Phycisphaeraceae bacterium]